MKRSLAVALLLLSLFTFHLSPLCAAYTPQSVPNPRTMDASAFVANPDAILSAAEVEAIQRIAQQLNQATGVELVTVALGDIGQADAFEFSLELFNHWGVGRSGQNTGVLIFFALRSRDIRIITGGGVEGLLPDAICSRILDEQMIPLLAEGQYGAGLLAGNKAIARRLTEDRALAELLLGYHPKPVTTAPWSWLSICSLLIALFALIRYWTSPRCPNCRKRGAHVHSKIISRATATADGQGMRYYDCPLCGHHWQRPFTIPKTPPPPQNYGGGRHYGGSFGGGGFSGGGSFGGGVSFGGGAGGKF